MHRAGYARLEVLLALVPDPIDSSSAELYDSAMRGLGEAMAGSGYLLDRLWLPWERAADTGNSDPGNADPGKTDSGKADPGKEKPYRRSPGLLLYRPGPAADRRLLSLLVVGETPKQGIHKAAFHQALRLAKALSDEGSAPLRVLGPSFSGSAESLRVVLAEDPLARGHPFSFVSGTATATNLAGYGALGPAGNVSFCRTVPSDSQLMFTALGFLVGDLGWRCGRLALLTESDTAFGSSALGDRRGIFCNDQGVRRNRPVFIPFPSGLAEVRTVREESGATAAPKPDSTGIQLPQPDLSLSLAEKIPPVDVVREESALTAPADDLALANLFTTVEHEHFRYLGILATDVRDELFLAGRIRRVAPDLVLFTVDSDLLQAHPQYSADLDGLIVVTSVPLVTESQRWRKLLGGPRSPFLLQFRNKFEKGVYLATRRLAPPIAPEARTDDRLGETGAWVAVVGNGALWPIFQRSAYRSDAEARADGACYARPALPPPSPPGAEARRERDRPPAVTASRGSRAASLDDLLQPDLALIVPLLVLLVGARWMGHTVARLEDDPAPVYPRRVDWTSASTGAGRLWAGGFAVLWLLGAAVMTVGALPIERQRSLPLALWGLLFSALLWAAAQPMGRSLLRPLPLARAAASALAGTLFLLAAAEAFLWLWIPSSTANAATQNDLFHFRARYFTNGLSPLVSLACLGAGFFVWIVVEVKRRTLVRRQRIDWPIPDAGDPALQPCAQLAQPIARLLLRPPGLGGDGARPGFWLAWLVLLVVSASLLLPRIQPIAESRAYGVAFAVLTFLLATLAAASFLQFFTLWRALDALLDRLQHSRLLPAFRRLADEVKWNPLRSFGRRVPRARLLVLAVGKLPPALQEGLAPFLAVILGSADSGSLAREIVARGVVNGALRSTAGDLAAAIDDPKVEELFAVRVIAYLRCVVVHLRSSLVGAFTPIFLLLAAVRTYAFAPQQAVSSVLWGTLLAMAALTLWVFVQMDRDDVLSAIAGSDAGQISFDRHLAWNAFVYGVIPVLTVVVGQFPQVGRFVAGWLNPLLRVTSGS